MHSFRHLRRWDAEADEEPGPSPRGFWFFLGGLALLASVSAMILMVMNITEDTKAKVLGATAAAFHSRLQGTPGGQGVASVQEGGASASGTTGAQAGAPGAHSVNLTAAWQNHRQQLLWWSIRGGSWGPDFAQAGVAARQALRVFGDSYQDCEAYQEAVGCAWTLEWNCPLQDPGAVDEASNDGTQGYYCCCVMGYWQELSDFDPATGDPVPFT
jgi:hypothetical protein